MLTKKHFEALAGALKNSRRSIDQYGEGEWHALNGVDVVEDKLVFVCKQENPNFNEAKFREWAAL